MISANKILNDIIAREGDFVNHPNDRGGPTKYGITLATLTNWRGREATIDDIKNLTKRVAFDIYYRFYYTAPNIDRLPEAIQPIMTDMAVNHGAKRAAKFLQELLVQLDFNIGQVDGVIGPKTVAAAESCYSVIGDQLINNLVNRRKAFFCQIVENDPTQVVFLDGWMNRANSFLV